MILAFLIGGVLVALSNSNHCIFRIRFLSYAGWFNFVVLGGTFHAIKISVKFINLIINLNLLWLLNIINALSWLANNQSSTLILFMALDGRYNLILIFDNIYGGSRNFQYSLVHRYSLLNESI